MPNPAGPRAADSAPTQPGAAARQDPHRNRQPCPERSPPPERSPHPERSPQSDRGKPDRAGREKATQRAGQKKRGEEKDKPEEFRSSDATSPFLRPFLSFANRRRGRDPRFAGTKVRKFFHRPRRTRSPEAKLFGLDHQSIDLDHQCIGHETRKDRHRAANDLPPPSLKKDGRPSGRMSATGGPGQIFRIFGSGFFGSRMLRVF